MADKVLWIRYEDLERLVQEGAHAASDPRLDPAEAGATDDLVAAWNDWEQALTSALRGCLTAAAVDVGPAWHYDAAALVEDMLDADRGDASQVVYRALLADDGASVLTEAGWDKYAEGAEGLDLDALIASLSSALQHLVASNGAGDLVEAVAESAWATGADAADYRDVMGS